MPRYTEVIKKFVVPFQMRHFRQDVPANSMVVHVGQDANEPGCFGVWYKYTTMLWDDDTMEMPTKTWLFGVVRTGEEFVAGSVHVGTIAQHDAEWHLLDLAPVRG